MLKVRLFTQMWLALVLAAVLLPWEAQARVLKTHVRTKLLQNAVQKSKGMSPILIGVLSCAASVVAGAILWYVLKIRGQLRAAKAEEAKQLEIEKAEEAERAAQAELRRQHRALTGHSMASSKTKRTASRKARSVRSSASVQGDDDPHAPNNLDSIHTPSSFIHLACMPQQPHFASPDRALSEKQRRAIRSQPHTRSSDQSSVHDKENQSGSKLERSNSLALHSRSSKRASRLRSRELRSYRPSEHSTLAALQSSYMTGMYPHMAAMRAPSAVDPAEWMLMSLPQAAYPSAPLPHTDYSTLLPGAPCHGMFPVHPWVQHHAAHAAALYTASLGTPEDEKENANPDVIVPGGMKDAELLKGESKSGSSEITPISPKSSSKLAISPKNALKDEPVRMTSDDLQSIRETGARATIVVVRKSDRSAPK